MKGRKKHNNTTFWLIASWLVSPRGKKDGHGNTVKTFLVRKGGKITAGYRWLPLEYHTQAAEQRSVFGSLLVIAGHCWL